MTAEPAAPPSATTIDEAIVGREAGPLVHAVDARWLMAYAAALGETAPRYFDTLAPAGPAAHPLFAVCYEWPAALAVRERTIHAALAPLGVHATHRLTIHRPPRAGDTLTTTARVTAVEPRRSGVLVTVRFATLDARGAAVTTTDYGSLYRGVALRGDAPRGAGPVPADARREPGAPATAADVRWTEPVTVAAQAAHVYTECARIWNPIHTDLAVARAAGLPGPILHGTATLALAVSRVLARDLGGDPDRVRTLAARFTGMVTLPSRFFVRGRARSESALAFDAVTLDGRPVLSEGALTI